MREAKIYMKGKSIRIKDFLIQTLKRRLAYPAKLSFIIEGDI
jgi:hypothetical protein